MANKAMKRCSTSYVIQVLQIKITIRYYYIPTKMSKINKKTTTTSKQKPPHKIKNKKLTTKNANKDIE